MTDFVAVATLDQIPVGRPLRVDVQGSGIALVRERDEVFALSDVCSHGAVNLSDGEVVDGTVECWLHGAQFDLRTGRPVSPPATEPVRVYEVQIHGDGEAAVVHVSTTPRPADTVKEQQ